MPFTERVATFAHRALASSLIVLSAGGLAFIAYGCGDIYWRSVQRKRLKQEKEASS